MEEVTADTPEFESTAAVAREGEDGSEVLQLGPADAATQPAVSDAAFAMHLSDAKKRAPLDKPSKPVTAAANASLIAALMGQPIAKPKANKPPAAATHVAAADDLTALDDAASDSLARYAGGGPGRASAETPKMPPSPAAIAIPPATPMEAQPVILAEHDPLPVPMPHPVMPQAAAAIIHPAPSAGTSPTPIVTATVAPTPPTAVLSGIPIGVTPASPSTGNSAPRATQASPLQQKPVRSEPKPVPAKPQPVAAKPQSTQPPVSTPPRRAIPVAPVWPGSDPVGGDARLRIRGPAVTATVETPTPGLIDFPAPAPMPTGAWWTIPLTFVGIAITACAVIVPAADENRRDTYELAKIERDVDYFQRQSAVNTDFIHRIDTDATLAERLALRQLHRTREGAKVVALGGLKPDRFAASPYAITRLDPPADLPAYRPVPGKLTEWFLGDKRPQQMAGLGLCVAGAGVLLGGLRKRRRPATPLQA